MNNFLSIVKAHQKALFSNSKPRNIISNLMFSEITVFSLPVGLYGAILILIAGFAVLIFGAGWLVDGASSAAKRYGVSDLAIGLTVVAFGTSMPEMIVSLLSALEGKNDASFGNVIGSNNFNMLFILGISGIIFPLAVQRNTVKFEIPLSLFAAVVLFILVNDKLLWSGDTDMLSTTDSFILLGGFLVFMFYIYRTMKVSPGDLAIGETAVVKPLGKSIGMIIAGLLMLIFGGKAVVDSATGMATAFGLSEKFIGLTILAAGTSLPELATSAVAAYRKNPDIAVGNVVGSSIFNVLFILGFTGLIHPIEYNTTLNFDLYVLFISTIMLILFMFTLGKHQLDRWEALVFLAAYIGYTIYLLMSDMGAPAPAN